MKKKMGRKRIDFPHPYFTLTDTIMCYEYIFSYQPLAAEKLNKGSFKLIAKKLLANALGHNIIKVWRMYELTLFFFSLKIVLLFVEVYQKEEW